MKIPGRCEGTTRRKVSHAVAIMLYHALFASQLLAAPIAWTDHATGFAIGGFDPVAYYTKQKPVRGEKGFEHRWRGVYWKFQNVSNRDAFAKHPEVYAPQFGGFDPLILSKGATVQGTPSVWAVHAGKLYLFRDINCLKMWRKDIEGISAAAAQNWEKLGRDLPGTSGM